MNQTVNFRQIIPGINRPIALFMIHSAIFHVGLFGITDVLLNFYLVSLGYSTETIGVLQAIPRLGGFLTGLPAGLLADRIGARKITIFGMLGIALSYVFLLAWPTLPMIAIGRFVVGVSYSAAFIASNPLMMAIAVPGYKTHLFSYYQIVTMLATSFGSFVGGYLPTLIVSAVYAAHAAADRVMDAQTPLAYRAALVVASGLSLLSIPPLLRLTEPLAIDHKKQTAAITRVPWLQLVFLSSPFLIFGVTAGLTFPFYNLFFRATFNIPDQTVGAILSLGWLGMGLIMVANPWLDRRFGKARAIGVTMTIAAVAFLCLSVAPTLALSVIAYLIAVSTRNTMTPLFQPLLMESLPVSLHNMASSIGSMLWSMGWFVATTISGFWQEQYGYGFIMQVVAVGVFLVGVSTVLIFRKRQPHADVPYTLIPQPLLPQGEGEANRGGKSPSP